MDRLPHAAGVWGFFGPRERPRGPGWFFGKVLRYDEAEQSYVVEWQNRGRKEMQSVVFDGNAALSFQERIPLDVPDGFEVQHDDRDQLWVSMLSHPERTAQEAIAEQAWEPVNRERRMETQRRLASIEEGRTRAARAPSRSASPPPRGCSPEPPDTHMLMPDGERSLFCSLEQEQLFLREGLTAREVYVAERALFAEAERNPAFIAYAGRFEDCAMGRICARLFSDRPRRSNKWKHKRVHGAVCDFVSKHYGERYMQTSVQLKEFENMAELQAVNPSFAEWIASHAEGEDLMGELGSDSE